MRLYTFLPDNLKLKQLFPSFSIQSASSHSQSHSKSFSKALFKGSVLFLLCHVVICDLRMFILNLNLLSFEKYIHKLWGELVLQFYQTLKHRRYFPLLFSFVFLCMLLRNKKLKWILQIQLFDSKSILSSIFRGNLRSCFLLIIFISQFLPWDKNKQIQHKHGQKKS